jgi:murein DD-endopeptidase MepM/ murein hydrolase activator NlpD
MIDSIVGFCKFHVTRVTSAIILGGLFIASVPASAEEAFPLEPVRKSASSSMLGDADPAFKEIFQNWGGEGTETATKLTIPSRKPVESYALTSSFGVRSDPFGAGRRNHKGLDMAGPIGTPIYATADGVVGRAGWVSGYGNFIEINHGNAIQTRYGHLSRLNVTANARVKSGDLIGFMGSTGRSTGSHLHYEVRIAGEAVNPIPFMQSNDFLVAQLSSSIAQGGPAE